MMLRSAGPGILEALPHRRQRRTHAHGRVPAVLLCLPGKKCSSGQSSRSEAPRKPPFCENSGINGGCLTQRQLLFLYEKSIQAIADGFKEGFQQLQDIFRRLAYFRLPALIGTKRDTVSCGKFTLRNAQLCSQFTNAYIIHIEFEMHPMSAFAKMVPRESPLSHSAR